MPLAARDKAEARARDFLSPVDPQNLVKKLFEAPLVDLASGKVGQLPRRWLDLVQRGGWLPPLQQDPAYDANASWEDYMVYAQRFYIHHPLVSSG
jgi:hypothetical protein